MAKTANKLAFVKCDIIIAGKTQILVSVYKLYKSYKFYKSNNDEGAAICVCWGK